MTTIKIISNPYSRNLSYFIYNEQNESWENITQESINSRLRENDEEKIYLPFKVNLNIDKVNSALIPLPPLAEQKRIVGIISAFLELVN